MDICIALGWHCGRVFKFQTQRAGYIVMTCDISISKPSALKPYVKPTLVKGPLLERVTAQSVSVGIPSCWVARAAFGERDIRWQIFRAWLFEDAPAWFRRLYLRYGENVGEWLEGRDDARRLVRAMMMPAIKSKLRNF